MHIQWVPGAVFVKILLEMNAGIMGRGGIIKNVDSTYILDLLCLAVSPSTSTVILNDLVLYHSLEL